MSYACLAQQQNCIHPSISILDLGAVRAPFYGVSNYDVSWSKFCSNRCVRIEARVKRNSRRIWIAMEKPSVKWAQYITTTNHSIRERCVKFWAVLLQCALKHERSLITNVIGRICHIYLYDYFPTSIESSETVYVTHFGDIETTPYV